MTPLSHIVILGGGTSGWLAASMLACHLKPHICKITLVESSDLGRIGIGESTIPPFIGLIQSLGIDEQDFIRRTEASFKLGIFFNDWKQKGSHYFHPFGVMGKRFGKHEFYQCWLKAQQQDSHLPLLDFSPSAVMADKNRFYLPSQAPNTPIGGANYALHVDATQIAHYFKNYSVSRGVVHLDRTVTHATRADNGDIDTLFFKEGDSLTADFFIDCTGFKSLLLGETLAVEKVDWSHLLPCNRAVAVKSEGLPEISPYTSALADSAGWRWQIPLKNRIGNGYVYASEFISDEKAKRRLYRELPGAPINEPRVIPFQTGRRRVLWQGNCLALGLAAGFVEPLESTAIHLVARGMEFFLRYFPHKNCDSALIREYNRRVIADYEEVRDFILLHYTTSQRDDTPFWRHCRNIALPDSLAERIELFKSQGLQREGTDELFRASSWQAVFEGMGIRPRQYCPRVDHVDFEPIYSQLQNARRAIATMVDTLPTHREYLNKLNAS